MSSQAVGTYKLNSFWESGRLIFYEKAYGHTTTGSVFILGHDYVQVGDTANDVDLAWKGTTTGTFTLDAADHTLVMTGVATSTDGAVTITNATATSSTTTGALIVTGGIATAADITCGDDLFMSSAGVINFNAGNVTITHAANKLTFAGATSVANGYAFDIAAGTITSEAHGVDITMAPTMASGKSAVGLNVKATATGTAGAWLSGLFVNATQAAKYVNGYLCAAEFELTSTAANASDNSVVVLNSVRNHTGSPPAADPYILLREYGTTYANVFVRVFGDTGQGDTTTFDVTKLVTEVQDTYEVNCRCAIRCMVGSTPMWLMASTTAPTS